MKKFSAFICMILSLTLLFSFTACTNTKLTNEATTTQVLSDDTLSVDARVSIDPSTFPKIRPYRDYNSDNMVFRNFEQWAPDFQLIRIGDNFGKISRHSGVGYPEGEENYVAFGDYSMKVQVLSQPTLYFPTYSKLFNYDYTDMSMVEYITMWIYNDEEEVHTVEVGLVSNVLDATNIEVAGGEVTKLDPKAWTRVCYYIELNYISVAASIKSIPGVYLKFDLVEETYLSEANTFYVDEVVFNYRESAPTIPDLLKLDKGEILSFDKLYQRYVCTAAPCKTKCISEFEVVKASDYGIKATTGEYVMRISNPPGDKKNETWPGIVIPENIMRKCDMMKVDKGDDDFAKYYVEFDIYGQNTENILAYPEFHSKGGGNWKAWNITSKPNEWCKFSLSFAEITATRTTNPGPMKLRFGEFVGSAPQVFFVDSFRIVKK